MDPTFILRRTHVTATGRGYEPLYYNRSARWVKDATLATVMTRAEAAAEAARWTDPLFHVSVLPAAEADHYRDGPGTPLQCPHRLGFNCKACWG